MAISNGIKVGVIVLALGAAVFMVFKNTKSENENDALLNSAQQTYKCSNGHEFMMTAAESRASATNNNGIVLCPQCQGPASEGYVCPSCKKVMPLVGHGSIPTSCPFCKASVDSSGPRAGKKR